MKSWEIVGYKYEAGLHCQDCARQRFGDKLGSEDLLDREGNPVQPVFVGDEHCPAGEYCDDCLSEIWEPDEDYLIARAAADAKAYFYRKNGKVYLNDNAPEWVRQMVLDAHYDEDMRLMLPDDWRYVMILQVLESIIDAVEGGEGYDTSLSQIDAPLSTHELLDYISSHLWRLAAADVYIERGNAKSICQAAELAWYEELQLVAAYVLESLREHVRTSVRT